MMSDEGSEGQTEQLWQALCESQRLDLVGQVTGSIAHDINNALSVVSGTTELLLEKLTEEVAEKGVGGDTAELLEQVLRDVQTILNWSDSTIQASHRLLEFSHRLRAREAELDLNSVVAEATELIRDRCEREEIILMVDPDESIPKVTGTSGQLLQAILNLIQNARAALSAQSGVRSITVGTSARDGRVCVEVEDNGPGISSDIAGKVFDPAFTTKEGSASAGLGLPISRMIATKHGGELSLEACDDGARFLLYLPGRTDS